MNRTSTRWTRTAAVTLAAIAALAANPETARADATACVVPPVDGSPLPEHVREARRRMKQFRPEKAGGWVRRAEQAYENARRLERGEIALEEADRAGGRAISGVFRVPVLPILYSDVTSPPMSRVQLQNLLFDSNPTGTLTSYYEEVSYGNLQVTGTVYDWVDAALPSNVYEGDDNGYDGGAGPLVRESVFRHDPFVDYGLFDNDGPDGIPNSGDDDGYVDLVIVVHPTAGGECGGPEIWSHHYYHSAWFGYSWETDDPSANGGAIRMDRYLIAPAAGCSGASQGIGIFAHELGHGIGIADLYDTDEDFQGDSQGIGFWGLMAAGNWNSTSSPAHMTAWTKHRLGWLTFVNPTQDLLQLCLPPVETNPTAVRLWGQGASSQEYFVVENRQQIGFDQFLPGEGLVIYHVNDERYNALKDVNDVNFDERYKSIDVECADAFTAAHVVNADDLDAMNNRGDAGDVWCQTGGGTEFRNDTVPDNRSYANMDSGIAVRNVGPCSGGIGGPPDWVCADFHVGNGSPVDVCIEDCDGDNCNEIATCEAYWESPNIWVDNDEDGDDDEPAFGVENKFHIKVRNKGPDAAVATSAQLWLAPGAMGLEWPDDAVQLVGTAAFPVIDPGEALVKTVVFQYPDLFDLIGHYCMGVVLNQAWDATLSHSPPLSNNVAQVNSQVLVARASDPAPGPDGRALCGGPFSKTTKIYLYDGYNPGQKPIFAKIRVGSPPDFNDALIPDTWVLDLNPGEGPYTLMPGMRDSVEVTMRADAAFHGESAHVPLTLWDISTDQAIGGITLDFLIDCHDPAAPEGLMAEWRDVPGDDLTEENVLVEWTPVTVDLGGNPEQIQYYEVWRSRDGATAALIKKVAIDREPATPGFQFYDSLPRADCPAQYAYYVRAVDVGSFTGPFSLPFELGCDPLGTPAPELAVLAGLRLSASPNPVAASTTIRFELAAESQVEVSLYDARGRRLETLVSEVRGSGAHAVTWNGRDDAGRRLASGVYFVRLEADGVRETRKLVLLR